MVLSNIELQKALNEVKDAKSSLAHYENIIKNSLETIKTDRQKMAVHLHDRFCLSDHNEICSWQYEIKNGRHDWNATTHVRYLDEADTIIASFDK